MQALVLASQLLDEFQLVRQWQMLLGIDQWEGRVELISPFQVCGESVEPGHELVGVVIEQALFTIVHTRDITEHDVIHELLHVAYPDRDHEWIEAWTDLLHQRVVSPESLKHEKEQPQMNTSPLELPAYNLRTRQKCTIQDPEIVTMKNGRKAVRGIASDDGKTRVFRILKATELASLEAASK